jgi:hypothetical protein
MRSSIVQYHSVWISMYKTYTFTDKATECLQSWSPFMVFLQRQIIIKIHVLPNHVIQDTMYIVARCLSALVLHLSAKIPTFERKKIHDWAQIYLCGRKFKISSYNVGFKTCKTFIFIIIWRCKNTINGDQDCKHSVALSVNVYVLYILIHTLWYTSLALKFQKEHSLGWEPLETLEYTTTHRFLRKVNLVKWVYDDLQVT